TTPAVNDTATACSEFGTHVARPKVSRSACRWPGRPSVRGVARSGDRATTRGASDGLMVESMRMFYDEVRDRLASLGILTAEQVGAQQRLLGGLRPESLPPAWAIHRAACEA